jgi:predicted nucleic acid-binding protein
LVAYAMNLASVFEVPEGDPIVAADPDDDVSLRCAVVADAAYVVSGDNHLLGAHADIPILTVRDFLAKEFSEQTD